MYDVMIIGGGPAGMTASIYAARKALDQVFISPDVGGQAAWAAEIENYLGYTLISGIDLAIKFEEHVQNFGVNRIDDRCVTLRRQGSTFFARTENGSEYESRAVIVASGRSARNMGVPGEDEFKGRGVSYCATCDAPLFKGEDVAVVGGGNAGVDAAIQLAKISNKVYIIEMGSQLTADSRFQQKIRNSNNVEVFTNTEVTEVYGHKLVEGICLKNFHNEDDLSVAVTGIFVEIGSLPNIGFLPSEVHVNKHGEISIDCANHTSLLGLFAAGDVTNIPNKQIIIAAGEGAKALLSAYHYLITGYPDGQ